MHKVYQIGITIYTLAIRVAALWNPKAQKMIDGRTNFSGLLAKIDQLPKSRVWFHFPSLGEFEQGRPVMEAWHRYYPHDAIVISFFSPSGFEVRNRYPLAALVCYLPFDQPSFAASFVGVLRPRMALFTKYDFWWNFFHQLKRHSIPLVMLSAIFRPDQIFFKWYGRFFRMILSQVTWFFVQNQDSKNLLTTIGIDRASVSGDTRFDRVLDISLHPKPLPEVRDFVKNSPVLVAGSTWPKDEQYLANWIHSAHIPHWKCIIVPHEIHEKGLNRLEKLFCGISVRYSAWLEHESSVQESGKTNPFRVLIVDQVGILASLYQFAQVAYIGNGFGKGIHNSLEAAIFGSPVVFGPHYAQFQEAVELVNLGAAFSFHDACGLEEIFHRLTPASVASRAGDQGREYCLSRAGASAAILRKIQQDLSPDRV